MKLKEMLKFDANMFKSLSIAEKIKMVESLQKIANKRIDALEKSGLESISYALFDRSEKRFPKMKRNAEKYARMERAYQVRVKAFRKSKGKSPIPVMNKKLVELEKNLTLALSDVQTFLKRPSSTIKGVRNTLRKASKDFINFNEIKNASSNQKKRFWEAYHRVLDLDQGLLKAVNYEILRQMFFNIVATKTKSGFRFKNIEEAIKTMENKLREEYAKKFGREFMPNSPFNMKLKTPEEEIIPLGKKLDTSIEDAPFKVYGESMSIFGDDDDD